VGLQPATPQKIADCLASKRSDLLKIIPKWEQSGQGKGGRDNEEEEHGSNHNGDEEQQDEQEDDSFSKLMTLLASNNSRRPSSISSILSPHAMDSLSHRPSRALQSRSSFLGGRPLYVLYYPSTPAIFIAATHQYSWPSQCASRAKYCEQYRQ
jgi:hypothetical protein